MQSLQCLSGLSCYQAVLGNCLPDLVEPVDLGPSGILRIRFCVEVFVVLSSRFLYMPEHFAFHSLDDEQLLSEREGVEFRQSLGELVRDALMAAAQGRRIGFLFYGRRGRKYLFRSVGRRLRRFFWNVLGMLWRDRRLRIFYFRLGWRNILFFWHGRSRWRRLRLLLSSASHALYGRCRF